MGRKPRGADGRSGSAQVLAHLAPGQRAMVVGTVAHTNPVIAQRLMQLGFRARAAVDVIRRAPLGDPTVYRVLGAELCLRRREARLIEVVVEQ